jgi:glycosyltransferase involved in cell wall biosynthesis
MRIALIADAFYPLKGGISHHMNSLCKAFKHKNHELYVFNPYYKSNRIFNNLIVSIKKFKINKGFFRYLAISINKLLRDNTISFNDKFKMWFYFWSNPRNLVIVFNNVVNVLPYLKRFNIDVIVGGFPSKTLPLIFFLSKILEKKAITFTYGNDFLRINLLERTLHLKTTYFKNVNKVIVLGNASKFFFQKIHNINDRKIDIFPLAIFPEDYEVKESREELRRKHNLSDKTILILSVGWHVPRKKFDLVIRAIKTIKEIRPNLDLKYFSAGKGISTQSLKELTQELGLEDYVKFFGECENNIRNELYKLSDIFVMPSITKENSIEGFGLVFLEANYHKVPVIGAYSGGIRDAVIDGKTGLLAKPNDLEDLTEKILYLCEKEEIRKEMGENGHKRVINEFLWEKRYSDFITLLERVISSK